MIHHVVYLQLNPEVNHADLENLVRSTRSLLLRIPEVLTVRSGRNLDSLSQWQFYYSFEVDSLEKLTATQANPFYLKMVETVIKPSVSDQTQITFELDPSKDLKYS